MADQSWSLIKYTDFFLTCSARFFTTMASQIQNVALGYFIYDITNSALALGFLGLAGFLPPVLLILTTGYVADHFDRRSVMVASAIMSGLTAFCLLLLVVLAPNVVWPIYPLIACFGASRSFYNPASQALVPNLVPKEHLSKAIAFTTGSGRFATISGPAIGGLLYWIDPHLPFYASVACYLFGAIASFTIRHRSAPTVAKEQTTWKTLLAGFSFAWSRPVVFGAITLDMFAVMLGGASGLFPIYAKDILHVGPQGLGLLQSAPAVGSVLMSMVLSHNKTLTQRHAGRRIFITVGCYGCAVVGFAFSSYLPLSLLCLTLAGAFDAISVVIRHTLVQAETPNELRGRVAAVNSLFISFSSEIGRFESGTVAWLFGTIPSAAIGGVGAIMIAGLWALTFPELRRRDHLVEEKKATASA